MKRTSLTALLTIGLVATTVAFSVADGTRGSAAGAATNEASFELPMVFVATDGLAGSRLYEASAPGTSFGLHPSGISMTMVPAGSSRDAGTPEATELFLRFVDANPAADVEPAQQAAGRVNFILGDDPDEWRIDEPAYTSIVYRELWDGIDLRVRTQRGALKYEFVVAPGADPAAVQLVYEGAFGLAVDDGALVVDTGRGPLVDAAPTAFQVLDGGVRAVDVGYALSGQTGYGFSVADYERSADLVIDPSIDFSTFIGGPLDEQAADIAVDSSGNVYLTGIVQSTTGFPTVNAFSGGHNGGIYDAFVAKFTPDGSNLVYATYLGGSPTPLRGGGTDDNERAFSIDVDGAGNAYVAGLTSALDFPTTAGAFQTSNAAPPLDQRNSSKDGFAVKLTPSGSLSYSTYLGGINEDKALAVDVDSAGRAHIAGNTISSNFPTTAGALQPALAGGDPSNFDGFLLVLDPSGSSADYSTFLGGTDNDNPTSITVDASGAVYLAGSTRSIDFPTTPGVFQEQHSSPVAGGPFDPVFEGFVTKLTPTANAGLTYSTFLGAAGGDNVTGLEIDGLGRAHVVGNAGSTSFPTTSGAYDTTSGAGFYSRISSSADALEYSTFLGGGFATDLVLGDGGDVWISGTAERGAVTTADAIQITNAGSFDMWLARLDGPTGQIDYATFLGGTVADNASSIAMSDAGKLLLGGRTFSDNFPTTAGAFDRTFSGNPTAFWGDAVVVQIDVGGSAPPPPPPPPPSAEFDTSSFSDRLRRNATVSHTIPVGAVGDLQFDLDWDDDRADVDVTILDPSGAVVFSDSSQAFPKAATVPVSSVGDHQLQLRNTTDRDADYNLVVTYPVAGTTPPPPPSDVVLTGMTVEPGSLFAGSDAVGRVLLSGGAPTGGSAVQLSSSNGTVGVPSSVTVTAGQAVAEFPVTTSATSTTVTSTVTATLGNSTQTFVVEVRPVPLPDLAGVSFNPSSVAGGDTSVGTVQLSGPVPSGGMQIDLTSDSAFATVPASVMVPAGATSVTFVVSTSPVGTTAVARITARRAASQFPSVSSNTLQVRQPDAPPPPGPEVETLFAPTTLVGGESGVGAVQLVSAAPTGGVTVSLASSDSALSVPATVTVPQGNSAASFSITTSVVSADVTATITATLGASSGTASVTVTAAEPPPPPPPPEAAVAAVSAPSTLEGGSVGIGSVQLVDPAPAGGVTVSLASSSSAASVPSTMTIPQGDSAGSFSISTSVVSADVATTITATLGSSSAAASVTVTAAEPPPPPPPDPAVDTVSAPATLVGGNSGAGTVRLVEAAPAGGVTVSLASSDPAVSAPSTVTVPQGSTSTGFTVNTSVVQADVTATITATLGSSSAAALVIVTPAAPPPPPSTEFVTVTFSGRLRRNATTSHSIPVGAAGDLQFDLDWEDSRADVDVTLLDSSGSVVFSDSSQAQPKASTVQVSSVGDHQFQLRNTTRRDAKYTLVVTYPVAG